MVHMAMLEEEDELEVVPELPVYHLPQEWLLLVSNEECLDRWLDGQSTLEGLTPGTPFRSVLSQYDSVRLRWLVKVRHDIASFGDVLVCRNHGISLAKVACPCAD